MNVTALSNINLRGPDAFVEEQADCIVVRTPNNPEYWWGNYTVFLGAVKQSASIYAKRAREHFADLPNVTQTTFFFDHGAEHLCEDFKGQGFEIDRGELMHWPIHKMVDVNHINPQIRQLNEPDIEQFIALSTLVNHNNEDVGGYLRIRTTSELSDRARQYFGIVIDGQLVGSATTILRGDWAGIDSVQTHPDFERRGYCRTLLSHAIANLQIEAPNAQITIDAEMGSAANAIYKRFGFDAVESYYGFTKSELL